MQSLLGRLGRCGLFLWSGWAGLTALCLLAALWQLGHEAYGDFILPSPAVTLATVADLLSRPDTWELTRLTVGRALKGFVFAALAGGITGLVAGYSPAALRLARPLITVLLGVPPIAWIVLAMIWFGASDGTVAFTILVAASPLVFVSVAEGIMSRDRGLDAMARAFGAGAFKRLTSLSLRHVAAHLFPALVLTLGTAFKVAVMAELLANVGGIGGELARSRANLDVAGALAWILISVAALIAVEYGIVHPVRAEFERWRAVTEPWGVKR
ncbi:ABC transporter permease [Steroidobacter denitrificans]|uniref:ABC transporter permease n=1 Tax=Steroidobacter denitrificans TaxID=465721 RepID=A0A127FDU7_STEDE|nr:ABC transporter permease subunit [Steroidobacter denitrificans]AMN47940.1 ABC transporter permease [Steroidobacter denitrificans]